MAIFDDLMKADTAKGLAIGMGVALVAPMLVSSLMGASRPFARAALKSGFILYEKAKEVAAEFSEVVEDLVAEARAEVEQQQAQAREAVAAEGAEAEPEAENARASGLQGAGS
jgi:hypothetical protein